MPLLAVAVCILWFVSLFVFRTALQWKKTGSTGVKGFHGRIGSLPWVAGVSASLGLVLTPLSPVASHLGWPGGTLLIANTPLHLAGTALALIGIGGALISQLTMGDSWRVGVDELEKTQLVVEGLFAWVRNPIFSFILLSVFGFVLLVPCVLSLLAAFLTVLGIEAQVRAVEEPYLKGAHGDAYMRYASAVGRFVPRLGRLVDASIPG